MKENNEYIGIQYEMFCNSIKHLYDSFYKLGAMTFALNGSLGAGYVVVISSEKILLNSYTALAIAFIGSFYNYGARAFYTFTLNGVTSILEELSNLVQNDDRFVFTDQIISRWGTNENKTVLVRSFFIILTTFWIIAFLVQLVFLILKLF